MGITHGAGADVRTSALTYNAKNEITSIQVQKRGSGVFI